MDDNERINLITTSLIPETLCDFTYYKRKLPLYLRNSNSFQEHFKIWYDLLVSEDRKGIVGNGEILINLLNIFADDYLTYLEEKEGSSPESTESDILDKIGNLFGISRYNLVTYYDEEIVAHTEEITLTNENFLIYIKAKIIQNYCNGSREQIQMFYDSLGLNRGLTINMQSNPTGEDATVNVYLIYEERESETLSDFDKMFLAGLLNINSMGINYRYMQPIVPTTILIWANADGTGGENNWDSGRWII